MVEKLQQSPLPNRILNRLLVMLSLEKETLNDSLEPGASRSTGPGPGRPRSGHRPESISGENATTTGAVCGPQLPARSVVVGVTSARTILRWTTSVALGRRLVRRALCHYAAQFSSHCAPCNKTAVSSRAAKQTTTSQRYGLAVVVNTALASVNCT